VDDRAGEIFNQYRDRISTRDVHYALRSPLTPPERAGILPVIEPSQIGTDV